MNCPYCKRKVNGLTGFDELRKFAAHLARCRKNPDNIVLTDGHKTVVTSVKYQTMNDALEIRSKSGQ